jgi:hypothetical protein
MPKFFSELREKLLRAGVAPRHVRRYLNELRDHFADLKAEEQSAGRGAADAESAALVRLGGLNDLVKAMVEQRQFQSWCARAPWVLFGLTPLALLALAWSGALFILWSGWQMFLPGAETPFGVHPGPHRLFELSNIYFQVGRMIYFFAPIVIGWGVAILAARQRLRAVWPGVGFVLIALAAGTLEVHARRPDGPSGAGHVSMGFASGPAQQVISADLVHALVFILIMVTPYLIWRVQRVLRIARQQIPQR